MWLQDTAGEVGVPYHLIKSGRARGDVLVLTKLKGKGKDIPSRFRPESKELPRIGKPVEGDSKLFPYVFSQQPLALHLPPPSSKTQIQRQTVQGKKIPFIKEKLSKISAGGGWWAASGPQVPPPKASLRTGSLSGSGNDSRGRQQIADTPCPYTQGPSATPSFSPCGW